MLLDNFFNADNSSRVVFKKVFGLCLFARVAVAKVTLVDNPYPDGALYRFVLPIPNADNYTLSMSNSSLSELLVQLNGLQNFITNACN